MKWLRLSSSAHPSAGLIAIQKSFVIREIERFNQQYALLFRYYLRAFEAVRTEYEVMKRRASMLFPDSIDRYLFLKDPVFHIIYEAACLWATATGWTPDDEYL